MDKEYILKDMEKTRYICSVVHKIRQQNKLSVKMPLQELQFSFKDGSFLSSQYRDIIADEVNVYHVEPFIIVGAGQYINYSDDIVEVSLMVDISNEQQRDFDFRTVKREEAAERKALGLNYNE